MTHTKGNWRIKGSSGYYEIRSKLGPIAVVVTQKEDKALANAYLIAAAPKLLKALEDLTGCVGNIENYQGIPAFEGAYFEALEAIKKAIK